MMREAGAETQALAVDAAELECFAGGNMDGVAALMAEEILAIDIEIIGLAEAHDLAETKMQRIVGGVGVVVLADESSRAVAAGMEQAVVVGVDAAGAQAALVVDAVREVDAGEDTRAGVARVAAAVRAVVEVGRGRSRSGSGHAR